MLEHWPPDLSTVPISAQHEGKPRPTTLCHCFQKAFETCKSLCRPVRGLCKSHMPWSIRRQTPAWPQGPFQHPEQFLIPGEVKVMSLQSPFSLGRRNCLKGTSFGFPNTHVAASAVPFLLNLGVLSCCSTTR